MATNRRETDPNASAEGGIPVLTVHGTWEQVFTDEQKSALEAILPGFLRHRRWFSGKGRPLRSAIITESIPVTHDGCRSYLALTQIDYLASDPEMYLIGLSFASESQAAQALSQDGRSILARLETAEGSGVLYDAVHDRGFVIALLDLIDREDQISGPKGRVLAIQTEKFDELRGQGMPVEPRVMGVEQSNTSVVFGERLILKLFRKLDVGTNPDLEIGRFLSEHGFFNTPPVAGALELRSTDLEPRTLGILQRFVPNRGDAWKYTLETLSHTLKQVSAEGNQIYSLPVPDVGPLQLIGQEPPSGLLRLAGSYLHSARLLGERTAQLHLTLNSSDNNPAFSPEPFSPDYQESVYRAMRTMATSILAMLQAHLQRIPTAERNQAKLLLRREDELLDSYRVVLGTPIDAGRIRIHGDYHLGQILFTGDDFVIIDFEGEPARSLAERRIKRSPLRDVAGMLRSFDYAAHTALLGISGTASEKHALNHFVQGWLAWVAAVFLDAYLATCYGARFLPADRGQLETMLDLFQFDKAVYELGYELNSRPTWVGIPISGITRILDQRSRQAAQRKVA